MNEELSTNHNMRIVSLANSDRVLCLFGEVKDKEEKVAGYRMVYPYLLTELYLSTTLDGVRSLLLKIIELVVSTSSVSFILIITLLKTMLTGYMRLG